jgi:hypothetical protein
MAASERIDPQTFLYQEQTKDGGVSAFNKLVSRETARSESHTTFFRHGKR